MGLYGFTLNLLNFQFKLQVVITIEEMGQERSALAHSQSYYQLPQYQYAIKRRINSALTIWKNKSSPFDELLEHKMIVNNQEQLEQILEIFQMRHEHRFLPSTKYLTYEQHGIKGCGEYYRGSLYFEPTITTLSKINDIPFQDSLHLFSVAFKGFEILYKKYGYFDIFEDMFHVCDSGKIKVWCNSAIYKLAPEPYLMDASGRQEDMIYRIIHLIDENVDKSDNDNFHCALQEKISQGSSYTTFDDVNSMFRAICRERGWLPPERLKCLAHLSREDIEKIFMQSQIPNGQETGNFGSGSQVSFSANHSRNSLNALLEKPKRNMEPIEQVTLRKKQSPPSNYNKSTEKHIPISPYPYQNADNVSIQQQPNRIGRIDYRSNSRESNQIQKNTFHLQNPQVISHQPTQKIMNYSPPVKTVNNYAANSYILSIPGPAQSQNLAGNRLNNVRYLPNSINRTAQNITIASPLSHTVPQPYNHLSPRYTTVQTSIQVQRPNITNAPPLQNYQNPIIFANSERYYLKNRQSSSQYLNSPPKAKPMQQSKIIESSANEKKLKESMTEKSVKSMNGKSVNSVNEKNENQFNTGEKKEESTEFTYTINGRTPTQRYEDASREKRGHAKINNEIADLQKITNGVQNEPINSKYDRPSQIQSRPFANYSSSQEYTDPKFMEMLSSWSRAGNKDQLFFSFSDTVMSKQTNAHVDFDGGSVKNSLEGDSKRTIQKLNFRQQRQNGKIYKPTIDTDIWNDLQQLKEKYSKRTG